MPTKTKIDIGMPKEYTGTSIWNDDQYIVFLTVQHDDLLPNPCEEQDGMGTMHSFNSHHINFIDPNSHKGEALLKKPDVVPLSYYEHGLCQWDTAGAGPQCQWDSVSFAGVWEPDQTLIDLANQRGLKGQERQKQMVQWAQECCKDYTHFCNGSIYEYVIQAFKLRKEGNNIFNKKNDYRFDEPIYEDSQGSFYGLESVEEAVEEAVQEIDLS